jgi:hypothetical protein
VFRASDELIGQEKYFARLHQQIEGEGAAAFLYDLQQMDLGSWHPRQILKTEALRDQQRKGLNPEDRWMLGLLEQGWLPGATAQKPFIATPTALKDDAHEDPNMRGFGKNKIADFLKKWGCRKIDHAGYFFPPLSEMRNKFDSRFGPQGWNDRSEWGSPDRPAVDLNGFPPS